MSAALPSLPSENLRLRVTGGLVAGISLLVAAGWIFDVPALVTFASDGSLMVMNTALGLLLCGGGFLALAQGWRRTAGVCGAAVAAGCAAVLLQFILKRPLGVDELFWKHQYVTPLMEPGRMALNSAFALLFLGCSLVLKARGRTHSWLQPVVVGMVVTFSVLPVLNYGLGQLFFSEEPGVYQGLALPTMGCLLLLAAGIVGSVKFPAREEGAALSFMAAALGMLISIGVVVTQSNSELAEANRQVTRTYEIRGGIDHFVSEIARMESTARAYALTGIASFAERYGFHKAEVSRQFDDVRSIVADNPGQLQRMERLRTLAEQKFAQSETLLRARRENGAAAAAEFLAGQPTNLTSALVNLAGEMQAEETRLLLERTRDRTMIERYTQMVRLLGGGLALVLMSLAFTTSRRFSIARRKAEEALQAANHLQRAVLDGTVFGVIATEPDGLIREFNAGAERMLGYTRAEMVGCQTPEIIHVPGEMAARAVELSVQLGRPIEPGFEAFIARARQGEVDEREWTYVRKDGERFPVLLSVTALRDSLGTITGFLGIAQDLSERRKAEKALLVSEERLRQVLRNADCLVWEAEVTLKGADWTWQMQVHPSGLMQRLIDATEIRQEAGLWYQFEIPEQQEMNRRSRAAMESGAPGYHQEFRVQRQGREYWIKESVAINRPEGGHYWLVGVATDITELKLAEIKVQEAFRQLEQQKFALDQHAIVAETDVQGNITYVNDRFCALSQYSREELIGRNHRLINSGHHPKEFFAEMYRTITSGKVWHGEICNRAKAGNLYWENSTIVPVTGTDGRIVKFIAIRADITARKHLEESLALARDQALEASRLKSEFLASVSHEIRTPMNGIIGMTGLLMDTPLSAAQQEMGRVVQNSAENLLTIINDILDFSKIEAGKMDIAAVEFELQPLVDEVLALLAPHAQQKNLGLHCDFDARLTPVLLGDAGRIRQVLLNLLGNAIKFTAQGEVTVAARWQSEHARRLRFCVEVRDTGIGIAPAAQKMLFQPFTQADGSTTRRFGGTGLGLAISRQLVELMGGEIGLSSEEGRGSSFWFSLELPMVTKAAAADRQPVAAARPPPAPAQKEFHLLVAEDNVTNQMVVRGLVERMGGMTDFANDGAAALQLLARKHYDAVLMDCQMPGMDGYAATRQIRAGAVPGANPRIPIIALTAYARPSDRQKCLEAGMDDYVPKPVRAEQLQHAIERCGLVVNPAARATAATGVSDDVLHAAQLAQLRELPGRKHVTLLEEVVEIFLQDTPTTLATLRGLADRREAAATAKLAHRLAGGCANLGGASMRRAAHAVELAADLNEWTGMPGKLSALDQEWTRLQAALQNLSTPQNP